MNIETSGVNSDDYLGKKKKRQIDLLSLLNYNGYSLVHAITAMVLLSLISITILTYVTLSAKLVQRSLKNDLSRTYCLQGFDLLNNQNLKYSKYYTYNIDGIYDLSLKKDFWGIYEQYTSIVCDNHNDTLHVKSALIGLSKDLTDNTALILSNSTSVFSVADSVFIYGDCYVPKGIFRSHVGSLRNSVIPEVLYKSPDTITTLRDVDLVMGELLSRTGDVSGNKKSLYLKDSIHNSFLNEPLVILADSLLITGTLKGKIILKANVIIIDSSARIDGPILISKFIKFQRNVKGSMQVFVTENLIIDEDVCFNYPSTICFFPQLDRISNSTSDNMVIYDRCSFFGDIYIINHLAKINVQFNDVKMHTGSIYCMEDISFSGKCSGPMVLKNLNNYKYSVAQKNLADNLTINVDSLPEYFTFSCISYFGTDKKVVQWCD